MQYSLLQVQQRVQVRAPLPFKVRDHDGTLLLARGHVNESTEQMLTLFARGALVDLAELQRLPNPTEPVQQARPEELPGLWTRCREALNDRLRNSAKDGFLDAARPSGSSRPRRR